MFFSSPPWAEKGEKMKKGMLVFLFAVLFVFGCGASQVQINPETDETYTVTVDYSQTLEQMIQTNHYDWYYDGINQNNFSVIGQGKTEVVLHLINKDKEATVAEIIKEMDRHGLRPATLPELLAFGAKYPEFQRQFPIVALGSVVVYSNGDCEVACLHEYNNERRLDLLNWYSVGHYDCRFLAVAK